MCFLWDHITRHHNFNSAFSNAAVASRTRLHPSPIPARRNSVRKCCFTVRGLILTWPAISLLLQPWTRKSSTTLADRGRNFHFCPDPSRQFFSGLLFLFLFLFRASDCGSVLSVKHILRQIFPGRRRRF